MAKVHKKKRLESKFKKKSKFTAKISSLTPLKDSHLGTEKKSFMEAHYKKLLIIPFLMLIAAFVIICIVSVVDPSGVSIVIFGIATHVNELGLLLPS